PPPAAEDANCDVKDDGRRKAYRDAERDFLGEAQLRAADAGQGAGDAGCGEADPVELKRLAAHDRRLRRSEGVREPTRDRPARKVARSEMRVVRRGAVHAAPPPARRESRLPVGRNEPL